MQVEQTKTVIEVQLPAAEQIRTSIAENLRERRYLRQLLKLVEQKANRGRRPDHVSGGAG